tara:strand:- start:7712 stop:7984 length:273 start_codon:yes stop_codon:yes gene_type:complete
MNKFLFIAVAALSLTKPAIAWDGTDSDSGVSIEIERGNLVRSGREIEFYDYDAGEYRTGQVQSIRRYGASVELEIEDEETGDTRTFEMDN